VERVDVSLIIGTRNRSKQLARSLESVGRIIFKRPWELIIVDNGSADTTVAAVRDFVASTTIPVFYVFEPRRGLGNAHNAGLKIARGKIVAFTDDDCYPSHDFLSRVWSSFEDVTVGYVTGCIMLHDPADYPITINHSTIPLTFPANSYLRPGAVQGANMAFRSSVLRDVGGFDPLFGPGSWFNIEDLDAAARASALGWKGRYCPEIVVSHHHGRKKANTSALLRSYAFGRGAYRMKLLLKGHHSFWSRPFYWVPQRGAWTIVWEVFGATTYLILCLHETLRYRIGGR
jgi:cellulose synthase/poly-beta-1,6-N-acetylglucosamine synthase-like glycosyltransferase